MPTPPHVACGGANLPLKAALVCFLDADSNPVVVTEDTPLPTSGGGSQLPVSSVSRVVNVSKGGNDATADGSLALPFLTVTAAMASISDAASAKYYSIDCGPGTFTEAGLVWKPFVYIKGHNHEWSTRISLTGGDLTLAAGFNTASGRGGISDIWFTGTGNIVLNLAAMPDSAVRVISFNDIRLNGNLTFSAKTASDAVEFANVELFTNCTLNGGAIYGDYLYVEGNLNLNGNGPDCAFDINSGACQTTVSVLCSGGFSVEGGLSSFEIQSSLNANQSGAGTCVVTADINSIPSDHNIFGTGQIILGSKAQNVFYAPTTPGNWPVQPVNVLDALDKLAARVAALEIIP